MAATDSEIQGFLENNRKFAETWKTPPTMDQMRAVASQAGGAFIILTCLDPRCVPEQFFGPEFRTAVYRNAGGRATRDAITSITVLRSLANAQAVLVVHHTGKRTLLPSAAWDPYCGVTHLTDDQVRSEAKARTPDAAEEIDATESYGCIDVADFEKTIKVDVEVLRSSKVLAGVEIRGLALDTETGLVRELKV